MGSFSINARYKPLSYEEYMQPFVLHQAAYENMSNSMDLLADESAKYSQYIQPGTKAYATQQDYLQQLKNLRDRLYEEGMSINLNGKNVRDLKGVFRNNILPINQAAQRMENTYNMVQKAQISNPHLMVGRMPNIDDYLADPTVSPKMIDGADLQKKSMALGETFAQDMVQAPEFRKINNFIQIIQRTGPTSEQRMLALQYLDNNPYFHQLLKSYGLDANTALANPELFNRAMGYVRSGFSLGFTSKAKAEVMEDPDAKFRRALALKQAGNPQPQPSSNQQFVNRRSIRGLKASSAVVNDQLSRNPYYKHKKLIDEYEKKGYINNNKITKEGAKFLKIDPKFQEVIEDLIGGPLSNYRKDSFSVRLESLKRASDNSKINSTDIEVIDIPVSGNEKTLYDRLTNSLGTNNKGESMLYLLDNIDLNTDGTYVLKTSQKGEKVKLKDLEEKNSITGLGVSPETRQVIITATDSKGALKHYVLDEKISKEIIGNISWDYFNTGNYRSASAAVFDGDPKALNKSRTVPVDGSLGGSFTGNEVWDYMFDE